MGPQAPSLERLSALNAVLLVGASALVAVVGHPWPLGVTALLSFGVLVAGGRGRFTPAGAFGLANGVTAFRLVVVLAVVLGLHRAPAPFIVAAVVVVVVLDGIDGVLARRYGTASPFGALFDVEVDALLAVSLCVELWQRDRFGAWILLSGLLRYVYVFVVAAVPPRSPEPRSLLGRLAFMACLVGLLGGLLEPGTVGTVSALLGTALVSASFARSFLFLFRA